MDARLAKSLLKVVQTPEQERFSLNASLKTFVSEFGIGRTTLTSAFFTAADRARIAALLAAKGIAADTPRDAWSGTSRSEALSLGPDEKWTDTPIRSSRLALRVLPGRCLRIGETGVTLPFPERVTLEWDLNDALSLTHDSVVVVENWQTFERINSVAIDLERAGDNPLIVWRGGQQHVSVATAMAFLERFGRPVWSFPDYDPAGLAIAASLPHLAGVLAPPEGVLLGQLQASRLSDRFQKQLAGSKSAIERSPNEDVQRLWAMIRRAGRAVPQEIFVQD